jgi:16S rRNA A1518/A1519 N6-dimethyltransferase RsmA/KsgA/DIM1 with predicted DNA glycosylase/AP lyase activity
MVVRIRFQPVPEGVRDVQGYSPALLKALVKGAFQQRRKTVVNSLAHAAIGGIADKDVISQHLHAAGIGVTRRADQITVREYIALSQAYEGRG